MHSTIIIGYGNIDRTDDGVAYEVINVLRQRLGQDIIREDTTGLENLNNKIDSIFLPQLVPEIMENIMGYDQLIFVDAHVCSVPSNINCSIIVPEYCNQTFTHHMTPAVLLAFLKLLYNREPVGHMVSIKGYNFDFKRGLSEETKKLIQPATEKILKLIK